MIFFVFHEKREANFTIELQECKGHGFSFQISQQKKYILPIDPVFSSWVNFLKKLPIINFSSNSKSLKGIIYFFL